MKVIKVIALASTAAGLFILGACGSGPAPMPVPAPAPAIDSGSSYVPSK